MFGFSHVFCLRCFVTVISFALLRVGKVIISVRSIPFMVFNLFFVEWMLPSWIFAWNVWGIVVGCLVWDLRLRSGISGSGEPTEVPLAPNHPHDPSDPPKFGKMFLLKELSSENKRFDLNSCWWLGKFEEKNEADLALEILRGVNDLPDMESGDD